MLSIFGILITYQVAALIFAFTIVLYIVFFRPLKKDWQPLDNNNLQSEIHDNLAPSHTLTSESRNNNTNQIYLNTMTGNIVTTPNVGTVEIDI